MDKLYSYGLTDRQMTEVLEVNIRTIHRWEKDNPRFYANCEKW